MECNGSEKICSLPDSDIMKANLLEVWKLQAWNKTHFLNTKGN